MLKRIVSFFTALSMTLMLFGALDISASPGDHAHKPCANSNHAGCSHSEIEYEPFPSGDDSLNEITSNKNFYLTEDLNDNTLLHDIFIEGATVNLCLNGHNIITQKKQITATNGTLNICDCGSGGYIKNTLYTEGVVGTGSLGTLNIYGGKFIGEKGGGIFTSEYSVTSDTNIYGGEISSAEADCIWLRTGSTLSIYGGTIESTTDEKDGIYTFGDTTININGGNIIGKRYGIRLNQGNNTVNIDGGTITGKKYGILINYSNNTVNINGGNIIGTDNDAINVKAGNTVNISGGKVLSENGSYSISNYGTTNISGGIIGGGNNYILNCGNLSLQGSPTLTNAGIYLYDDNNITISGALTNTEAYPIYVQNSSLPRTFTNGWDTHMTDKNVSKYFKSPYNTVKIAYRNNEAAKVFYYKITYDANGGSCTLQSSEAGTSDKLTSLADAKKDGYIFAGWFTEADGGEQITTDTVFTNDTTIYAHWTCDHIWADTYQKNDDQHWQVCTKCGAESEKTDHDWGDAYQSDDSQHWKICTKCNEAGTKENHTWDSGVTDDTTGDITYTCSVCEATKTDTHTHTHTFTTDWTTDDDYHWHAATCEHTSEVSGKAEHTEDSGTVTLQPTETTTGTKIFKCSVCGYVMRTETVPVTGVEHVHDFGTDWKYDNTNHWHECSCGEKSDLAAHSENGGVVTLAPTGTTNGEMTYRCNVCGTITRTETIPATGVIPVPTPTPVPPSPPVTSPTPIVSPSDSSDDDEPFIVDNKDIEGWESISEDIHITADGGLVDVDMNGTVILPKSIVEDIAGRDIDLALEMDSGITWTINGLTVTNAQRTNMKVYMNRSKIPADVLGTVSEGLYVKELTLKHTGEFGFTPVLTVKLPDKFDDKYANLFYYNSKSKEMEFVNFSVIKDGTAKLAFTHASEYAVVVSDMPMGGEDISVAAGIFSDSDILDTNKAAYPVCFTVVLIAAGISAVIFVRRRQK